MNQIEFTQHSHIITKHTKMLLTKPTRKAKKFLHKTLHNLTSFFMEGYQKLPKSPFTTCRDHKHKDQFLEPFDPSKEEEEAQEGIKKQSVAPKKKQRMKERHRRDSSPSMDINGGSFALARKMKELDMVDEGDLEHVLDVEEALHYYSRLRSPVYLDIVDSFFVDVYSELNVVPQHSSSSSFCNSKRRRGSYRF